MVTMGYINYLGYLVNRVLVQQIVISWQSHYSLSLQSSSVKHETAAHVSWFLGSWCRPAGERSGDSLGRGWWHLHFTSDLIDRSQSRWRTLSRWVHRVHQVEQKLTHNNSSNEADLDNQVDFLITECGKNASKSVHVGCALT